jgi:hypothetical protein
MAKLSFFVNGNDRAVEGGTEDLRTLLLRVAPHPDDAKSTGIFLPRFGGNRRNVTVLAVNYAYRELAMNLICNLKRVGISNWVVLAMDRAVYRYISDRMGNVFYHSAGADMPVGAEAVGEPADMDIPPPDEAENGAADDPNDQGYLFGSAGFVRTSRRKSMMVAEVVMLGYDVLFCDVDVVLFKNPHERLAEYAEDFLVSSDRRHADSAAPINHNINSGLYYVRGRGRNFLTVRAIVRYGRKTGRSEQKAFNHVLCGAFKDDIDGPGWRFGGNRCFYRALGGVTVSVLMLEEFANGSNDDLFADPASSVAERLPHVIALHLNYVSGRNAKIDRIRRIGKWYFDPDAGVGVDGCRADPITSAGADAGSSARANKR